MATVRRTIRILVEGEPENTFLLKRIINRYDFCFPNINFEVIKVGSKSKLLSDPTTSHNLNHTDLNTLRNDIYNIIERIEPAHNIPDYKERFLIHIFKHGGDVIFLTNLDVLFEELNINDENFIGEIRELCNPERLEELPQNPDEKSYEKCLLKRILRKSGKSYSIRILRSLIDRLRIEDLIQRLPHFKLFLIDLFKFAEEDKIPSILRDLL